MGGSAFGTQANRLTDAQHTALQAHVKALLDAEGFDTAIAPGPSKETHGDVDLLVGSQWPFKGQSFGEAGLSLEELGDSLVGLPWEEKHERAGEGTDAWCAALCRHLGGERWTRNGDVLSIAIPVAVLATLPSPQLELDTAPNPGPVSGAESQKEGEGFYQVDLLFFPGDSLTWAQMTHSFGHARQLLSRLVRAATGSGHFVVRMGPSGGLGLWIPTPTEPRVSGVSLDPTTELGLTSDTDRFCEWLGIEAYDAERLEEGGYGPHEDDAGDNGLERLYAWLGSGELGSLAAVGYGRLVREWRAGTAKRKAKKGEALSKRQQKLRREDEAADGFCRWLSEKGLGEGEEPDEGPEEVETATVEFFGESDMYRNLVSGAIGVCTG